MLYHLAFCRQKWHQKCFCFKCAVTKATTLSPWQSAATTQPHSVTWHLFSWGLLCIEGNQWAEVQHSIAYSAFISPQLFPEHREDLYSHRHGNYTQKRQAEWPGWGKTLCLSVKDLKYHLCQRYTTAHYKCWEIRCETVDLSNPKHLTEEVASYQAKAGTALVLDWFSWPYPICEAWKQVSLTESKSSSPSTVWMINRA